jgi:hypothetical protein
MTKAEFTDEQFNLPRPGAPKIDNCIATILRHDNRNRSGWLNLDRIARAQGFDLAEFSARFAHLEHAWEAELSRVSRQPLNDFDVEGK